MAGELRRQYGIRWPPFVTVLEMWAGDQEFRRGSVASHRYVIQNRHSRQRLDVDIMRHRCHRVREEEQSRAAGERRSDANRTQDGNRAPPHAVDDEGGAYGEEELIDATCGLMSQAYTIDNKIDKWTWHDTSKSTGQTTEKVLFGKPLALRRLLPMVRIDYIRVPGNEWVEDPENRFQSIPSPGLP